MFCPNCGRDCKDFKFCPDCGRNLQELVVESPSEKQRQASDNETRSFCPRCSSANLSVENIELPIKDSVLYWGAYSRLAGALPARRAEEEYLKKQKRGPQHECLDCGHKWYPNMIGMRKQHQPYLEPLLKGKNSVVYYGAKGTTLTLEWDRLIIDSSEGLLKGPIHPYEIWYQNLHCVKQDFHYTLTKEPEPRWLTVCDQKNARWPGPGTPKLAASDPYTILYDKSQIEEFRKVKDALNGIIEENKKAGLL